MSRAFVNEDADEPEPRYVLPKRDHPSYDEAAAWALIEGANAGNSRSAEIATGYKWGEPKLVPHIEEILARAREEKDERTEELAGRFLRKVRGERISATGSRSPRCHRMQVGVSQDPGQECGL